MADCDKLKKYLHLPVQSGSDRILSLMNRNYSQDFYLQLVKDYRKIVTDGQFTTDVIVGFPSESENDFQDTYNLVKSVEFDAAYIFKYSARPHSEAAKLPDDVTRQEKERRHKTILDLQKEISNKKKC
jgi:tRNA-2-methylthio-N6-dimethylallyladenosine synthase